MALRPAAVLLLMDRLYATSSDRRDGANPANPANLSAGLSIQALRGAYNAGLTVSALLETISARIDRAESDNVWISRVPADRLSARARDLDVRHADGEALPLYGIPFAVKDNIDAAGLPTTAGCPEYAYQPDRAATVVTRLENAGAILVGKTNLDQFATGLVGVRSPYGVPVNPFDSDYVPGGSSSGSAVAVASGMVSFALGTDTAGSGRVPAAFNNLVGLKPTRGLLSAAGVVPACRSLDCVSIFALTSSDAAEVLAAAAGPDSRDAYSRDMPPTCPPAAIPNLRIGIPKPDQLDFFGDPAAQRQFEDAVERAQDLCGAVVEIDYAPFRECAALLYGGPWVAERHAAVGTFIGTHPNSADPVVAQIIKGGATPTARDFFEARYRLEALRRAAETVFEEIDVLMLPTAGTIYTIAEIAADPIALNNNLGLYTNFMNLMDMAGVAVPSGLREDGLPFGVTFAAPAFSEPLLLRLGDAYHRSTGLTLGATGLGMPPSAGEELAVLSELVPPQDAVTIAVFGAHMRGQPLSPMLERLGGRFLQAGTTAAAYRMIALPDGPPARPGLIRVPNGGSAIELELWSLPRQAVGELLEQIDPPLGLGSVELADGTLVKGFICEGIARDGADDITAYGGWRAYLAANRQQPIKA